jgi:hypothetical protein
VLVNKVNIGIGAAWLWASACGVEVDSNRYWTSAQDPLPGLYTPGNIVGADPNSDGGIAVSERELTEALLRNGGDLSTRCGALPADIGLTKDESDAAMANNTLANRTYTPGSLTVAYTTKDQGERWAPANVGAVWIADPQDRPVRTIELWAAERRGSLGVFLSKACTLPEPDVVSQATIEEHTAHKAKWDGKDRMGNVVPDGTYVLFIEVAETELKFGGRARVPFRKSALAEPQNIGDTPATSALTLEYVPTTDAVPATPPTGP